MISDRRPPNRIAPTPSQRRSLRYWLGDTKRPIGTNRWAWLFRGNCNLFAVIIGVCHKSRTIYWTDGAGWTFTDHRNHGWTIVDGETRRLRFWSYRGRFLEACIGWMTSGAFALTIRCANARQPGQTP